MDASSPSLFATIASPADTTLPQYSPGQVVRLWAAAALPMGALSWLVNPWLATRLDEAAGIHGTARILLMTLGLAWQFVLVMVVVRHESQALSWTVVRDGLWLRTPRHPRTGQPDVRLWLALTVLLPLYAVAVFLLVPVLNRAWVTALPFLAEPPEFSFAQLLAAPAIRALAGAWWFYGMFLIMALFNTVLGEELLFRGLLLPRMQTAFGKWAWMANGLLFGVYHLHQPWGMPGSALTGVFLFALPTMIFRTAWMGVALHSVQSIYLALALLPAFLGRT